jgi:ribosomal protein S15P/S13E
MSLRGESKSRQPKTAELYVKAMKFRQHLRKKKFLPEDNSSRKNLQAIRHRTRQIQRHAS